MNHNLYSLLASGFPAAASAPCMILPDGRVWTYGDVERASARMANMIVALGLKPGDRLAAQVEKTPEALVLYLASLRAGTVFLPLNPAYQRHELEHFLKDATPGLFVCRPPMRALADELAAAAGVAQVLELDDAGRGSLIDAAAPHADEFATLPREKSDLAAILYTSGTTGRSKGAMLSHGNLAHNARTLHEYWHFRPGDVLLHMLPTFHVHGLFVACHTALLNGSAMFFEPKFDAARAMNLLPQSTVMMGVPTYYVRLLLDPGYLTYPERGLVGKATDHNLVLVGGKGPGDPFLASIIWNQAVTNRRSLAWRNSRSLSPSFASNSSNCPNCSSS